MSDPVRGEPLTQLAERLRRDIEQTDSKTVVLVGVGPASATHEALLCAAMRLAQDRDLVARQYALNFQDVFETVVPCLMAALETLTLSAANSIEEEE